MQLAFLSSQFGVKLQFFHLSHRQGLVNLSHQFCSACEILDVCLVWFYQLAICYYYQYINTFDHHQYVNVILPAILKTVVLFIAFTSQKTVLCSLMMMRLCIVDWRTLCLWELWHSAINITHNRVPQLPQTLSESFNYAAANGTTRGLKNHYNVAGGFIQTEWYFFYILRMV